MIIINVYLSIQTLISWIYSIFVCSANLISMTKKVMNVSFVLFTFFTNLIYPSLKMTSRICPEFFHVRNLSGSNFLCLEFVQVYLSRICPEFFMLGICLVYLSRIYPEFFIFGICSEFILYLSRFIVQNLSRIFILDKY